MAAFNFQGAVSDGKKKFQLDFIAGGESEIEVVDADELRALDKNKSSLA
jgi:hypothetical protein